MKPRLLLDSSAILRSDLDFSDGGYAITAAVREEVMLGNEALALEAGIMQGDVAIVSPDDSDMEAVRDAARGSGDASSLSETDMGLLACALTLSIPLMTDDYAIQNTAKSLGIECIASQKSGIRREMRWVWSCAGCRRKMDGPGACDICGAEAKRRRKR